MENGKSDSIQIDLNQFKLHLNLPGQQTLSLHFDTPSRRFYLSVIALVVEEMKKNGRMGFVLLEDHAAILALLNETVGGSAGSSKKRKLLPRIYRKWKGALPDLENAPLFKVIGRKKGYDDASGKAYRFDERATDAWANLFEYKGSGEKVRLRFSVERLGAKLNNVAVLYGNPADKDEGNAWDRFLEHLRNDVRSGIQADNGKDGGRDGVAKPDSEEIQGMEREDSSRMDRGLKPFPRGVEPEPISRENFSKWLEKQGGIEKIPLTTRLEIIASLAMAPGAAFEPAAPHQKTKSSHILPDRPEPPDSPEKRPMDSGISFPEDAEISEMLMESISTSGNNAMLYMAPELKGGQPPSPRSEVYALGVLLFQLVVGDLSRPLDPDWEEAVSDPILREDIAACVDPLPEKRLAYPMELSERLRTQNERRGLLVQSTRTALIQAVPSQSQQSRKWLFYGAALVVILGLLTIFAIHQQKVTRAEAAKKQAYKINLPKIKQLLEDEKYVEAHSLAKEAEKFIPADPTLVQYIQDATNTMNIETMPAGARVSYRPYTDLKGPWIDLGVTPIKEMLVPVGMHRLRILKEGYKERNPVRPVTLRNGYGEAKYATWSQREWRFRLYEKSRVPDGMLSIDAGSFTVPINAVPMTLGELALGDFFIDEKEVTNRAYKEFLDTGGYADPVYWKQEFKKDGQVISWAEAIKQFVDRTGRPGPSTWELGNYPEGQDDYPVSGVSWFEAAAYAQFRGKTLPTIYHWCRAAFPTGENFTPLTPLIIPQSNIEGTAIAETGHFPGTGSSGAKDMAGNVREWCWNAVGENRYSLGGMWEDATYMFNESIASSAWDRYAGNGFRCALYPEDAPVSDELLKETLLGFYDPYSIPPFSKEAFQAIKAMFAYKPTPLNPVVESREKGGRGWIREKISIDAAYNNERLIIYLDLPAGCRPPYKAVVYFPGGNAFQQKVFSRNFLWAPWDLLPENGRAFISPVYAGTYERGGGDVSRFVKKNFVQRFSEYLKDLRRTIDYLETRKDIDSESIVYLGMCSGAMMGPLFSPYEERIRGLILVSGGILNPVVRPKPKGLVQPFVTVPVLMLNGKHDYVFPVNTHQKPLFDLIGTPAEHKKHIIYESGHLPLPRAPMMKEIFAWLDKYQGPVECGGNIRPGDLTAHRDR